MKKIKWGILSTAKIGINSVIPAFMKSDLCEIVAISSRSLEKAKEAAAKLGIERAYGSYEELISDPDIEAIYNPLPNHMHLEWNIRTMEAGKHILCEKPLGLSVDEVMKMIEVRDRCGVKAGEAFMVKSNPQWIDLRNRIRNGEAGKLRLVQGAFSYFNNDPENIRNKPEMGGGGVWDIGCYPVTLSRYIYEEEPVRVISTLEFDPEFNTDRLASAILEYPSGHAIFTSSTQLVPYQRMNIFGTEGHFEVRIPFNAPVDKPYNIQYDKGSIYFDEIESIEFPVNDQYTLMGDDFSRAILNDSEVPVPFEDSLLNTKVIEAVYESVRKGGWITIK